MKADLAVVGGGPAGLAAAASAAAYGAEVVVIDEPPVPGGRLASQLHEHPGNGGQPVWVHGRLEAKRLLTEALGRGVRMLSSTSVWGLFPGWQIPLSGHHAQEDVTAEAVVLATGASQKALALPGWTLPGVLGVGAVQTMVNQYQIRPGKRTVIIGADALALNVARQMSMVGVEVLGVVLPPPGRLSGTRALPASVLAEMLRLAPLAPSLGLRLAGMVAKSLDIGQIAARLYPAEGVCVFDVPVMARRTALAIEGNGAAQAVVLADLTADGNVVPGSEHRVEVDFVCLSGGLSPLAELALQAGCKTVYMDELGGHVPLYGPDLSTTVPGIFVAGNITGVEGAGVAEAQGRLAGLAAAAALGRVAAEKRTELIADARAQVAAARAGAPLQFHANIASARAKLAAVWEKQMVVTGA